MSKRHEDPKHHDAAKGDAAAGDALAALTDYLENGGRLMVPCPASPLDDDGRHHGKGTKCALCHGTGFAPWPVPK